MTDWNLDSDHSLQLKGKLVIKMICNYKYFVQKNEMSPEIF